MLGYISVVKQRTKPEYIDEYIKIFKEMSIKDIQGIRRRSLIQTDENNFMGVLEYDDISSLVEAQDTLVSFLDRLRHCLVEVDDEGNVTEPASGTLIYDEKVGDV